MLGLSYFHAHRYTDSERTHDRLSSIQPGRSGLVYGALSELARTGDVGAVRDRIGAWSPEGRSTLASQFVFENTTTLLRILRRETQLRIWETGGRSDMPYTVAWSQANYYYLMGDDERAAIHADEAVRLMKDQPGDLIRAMSLGVMYTRMGEEAEAVAALREHDPEPLGRFAWGPFLRRLTAQTYSHFGRVEEAIDILEEILPAPSWLSVPLLRVDPIWDPLRDHPRFQALLEKYEHEVY